LPKPVATQGLRAARELGKKGEALVVALTPLADATSTTSVHDFKSLTEFTKRDGDPARGELIYRRANLGCVICHAIGGGGRKGWTRVDEPRRKRSA
jgi:cytochrome c